MSTEDPSPEGADDGWAQDLGSLYILEESLVRMPTMLPSERKRLDEIYRSSGELTREMLALVMHGEFW